MGLSIGDVEKITGISKDRLRYYEEKKLIVPDRNDENSYRSYDDNEVLKLLGIQLYRAMDMGVKEIQEVQEAGSPEDVRNIFAGRQAHITAQIAELQRQNECVKRCIEDCDKVSKHLGKISIQKVPGFRLSDRIEDLLDPWEAEKFRDDTSGQKLIIRSFVRRLELTPDGIVDNSLFVIEEDGNNPVDCLYTVVADSKEHDPMMETYADCMKWIKENKVEIGQYCYIRPLLISNLGNVLGSYLEVIAPLAK